MPAPTSSRSFPAAQSEATTTSRPCTRALPQIPLIAAGGVNQQTAAGFIFAGATAIGVGTELIPTEAIERRQSERIRELARRFVKLVKDAHAQIEAWKQTVVVKNFTGTEECEK